MRDFLYLNEKVFSFDSLKIYRSIDEGDYKWKPNLSQECLMFFIVNKNKLKNRRQRNSFKSLYG